MYEIDNEKFGAFLLRLRKEHGMTQKDLAERLFVSDKAVSKWERGLSLPDVALLQPLADIMGVTVTELLAGEYIQKDRSLNISDVEPIMRKSLRLTATEQAEQNARRRLWKVKFLTACLCAAVELVIVIFVLKFEPMSMGYALILPPLLAFIFGIHFIFFAKEQLPAFYDENKISFYSSGAFRMNMAGINFNNSNWPHILNAIRTWCVSVLAGWPVPCGLIQKVLAERLPEQMWTNVLLMLLLAVTVGGLLVPVYVVGRKYE